MLQQRCGLYGDPIGAPLDGNYPRVLGSEPFRETPGQRGNPDAADNSPAGKALRRGA